MADLESTGSSQFAKPKGAVLSGFVSTPNEATAQIDDDPSDATIKYVAERGKTAKNRNMIH